MIRAGQGFKCCLILWLILKYKNITNINININLINGVDTTNNLPKIKHGANIISLGE